LVLALTFLGGFLVGRSSVDDEPEVVQAADSADSDDDAGEEADDGLGNRPEEDEAPTTTTESEEDEPPSTTAPAAAGELDVRVRWTSEHTFSMFVTEPSGQTISSDNPSSLNGAVFDDESYVGTCSSATEESYQRVTWPEGAPTGTYEVYVTIDLCSLTRTRGTFFMIEVLLDDQVIETFSDTIGQNELDDAESETYTFEVRA